MLGNHHGCRIDALDQWCSRPLLGITWYQFVCNVEVWRITKQPNLTAIIQSQCLSIFARMDDPNGSPNTELEETTMASSYHVAERCPEGSESLQPHTE